MIKVIKRISEYTKDEFNQYCVTHGLDPTLYAFNIWAIAKHDEDLDRFVRLAGPNTVITVSGVVCLDHTHHKVKDKTFSLTKAFDEMITPDAQDYCVVISPGGKYYVFVVHSRGHNVFKFSLNNDKNRTTTSSN